MLVGIAVSPNCVLFLRPQRPEGALVDDAQAGSPVIVDDAQGNKVITFEEEE